MLALFFGFCCNKFIFPLFSCPRVIETPCFRFPVLSFPMERKKMQRKTEKTSKKKKIRPSSKQTNNERKKENRNKEQILPFGFYCVLLYILCLVVGCFDVLFFSFSWRKMKIVHGGKTMLREFYFSKIWFVDCRFLCVSISKKIPCCTDSFLFPFFFFRIQKNFITFNIFPPKWFPLCSLNLTKNKGEKYKLLLYKKTFHF